ncbi:hypothetical protein [Marilutibacter spongiae]|uniref:Uncharacterized protein n=1 Tax=Marilutibacter spongiae TaxID=2025720 RepID=A0A7W3Y5J3_9GAMM|nr:hypothetical protein [Lysobacter spongiae]MBB1060257.1 hypothetical protein [Lysobacter spongiae]
MHAPEPDHERLRRHLQALPEPLPPASLESRLRASQARRSRVLRIGASVLALGLVAVIALPGYDGSRLDGATDASTTRIAAAGHGAGRAAGDATHLKLQAIDRALQTAYARGASDAEVAPLWEARSRLVHDLAPSGGANGGTSS